MVVHQPPRGCSVPGAGSAPGTAPGTGEHTVVVTKPVAMMPGNGAVDAVALTETVIENVEAQVVKPTVSVQCCVSADAWQCLERLMTHSLQSAALDTLTAAAAADVWILACPDVAVQSAGGDESGIDSCTVPGVGLSPAAAAVPPGGCHPHCVSATERLAC